MTDTVSFTCSQDDEKYCASMHKEVYYKGEYRALYVIVTISLARGWAGGFYARFV